MKDYCIRIGRTINDSEFHHVTCEENEITGIVMALYRYATKRAINPICATYCEGAWYVAKEEIVVIDCM